MFTGLVEARGRIASMRGHASGSEIVIEAELAAELSRGQSIAVDGVCLTVAATEPGRFRVTAVAETMRRSAFGEKRAGSLVNLERSLKLGDRMDGHLVLGHVDGVASVDRVRETPPGREVSLAVEPALLRFVAEKGSVALDGVSLTVAAVSARGFEVALVPHTLEVTTLGGWRPGRRVNVEIDLLARYVARWLEGEERGHSYELQRS